MNKTKIKIIGLLILILNIITSYLATAQAISKEEKVLINEKKLMDRIIKTKNNNFERLEQIEESKRIEEEKRMKVKQKIENNKSKNPYWDKKFKIEKTFYSENESTDTKGYENKTCIGIDLFEGVIAIPNEIPLYSIFLFDNRLYIALDRGNPECIKMLNDEGDMRVDVFVPGASEQILEEFGVQDTSCQIIRWGGNSFSLQKDIENLKRINETIKYNQNIDIDIDFEDILCD